MTLFETPRITAGIQELIDEADRLRGRIGASVAVPGGWVSVLRRDAEATAYASSTEIEGFHVSAERIVPVAGGASPDSPGERALASYAHAMRHVGAMAADPGFEWNSRALLDLHFDACNFQPDMNPGLLRETPIYVTGDGGRTAYVGPDSDQLRGLINELVDWLNDSTSVHPLVAGAMAHLQVVSIHPFEDGNGRVSRIVQSLVLATRGELIAELGSIEPFLARNTAAYYAVLEDVQGGSFSPKRDASPWVEFCLRAHIEQATLREGTIAAAAARWERLETIVERREWPDRLTIALERALTGGCDRSGYSAEADVSLPTATNDLRRLVDAELVQSVGAARSTHYLPTDNLKALLRG
jgi:Fic family protein